MLSDNLVENSITGISIIQNDQVVYQNPLQEKLFGPLPRKTKLVEIETIHPDDIDGQRVIRLALNVYLANHQLSDIIFQITQVFYYFFFVKILAN